MIEELILKIVTLWGIIFTPIFIICAMFGILLIPVDWFFGITIVLFLLRIGTDTDPYIY